ncbi:MAG TPA: rod shape-determining protein MreD [Gemmatimonadaceae bacterium]|nr:rod shape-determining protein MreD [Gemmatimonadaceae bacterium]
MKGWSALRTALAFVILVVLHYTLRPMLAWRAEPDFLLIATLLVAIRVRPGTAALLGFALGLIADSLTVHAFGAGALGLALVAFAASWLKAVFFADNAALNAFFFFVGKWAFNTIYLIVEHRFTGGELIEQIFVWSVLSAAVTAFVGLAILLILRPILRPSTS